MKVVLLRHTPALIAPGICYGRLDVPADPAGQARIDELAVAGALETSKRIWTSPSQRCQVMADAIARHLSIPKTTDPRLQELDFGAWEGKAWEDVPRAALDEWSADPETFRPPGGESGAELIARCRTVYVDICRAGEDCAIVSHGGPLAALRALFLGRPVDLLDPKPTTGSLYVIGPTSLKAPAPPAGN